MEKNHLNVQFANVAPRWQVFLRHKRETIERLIAAIKDEGTAETVMTETAVAEMTIPETAVSDLKVEDLL